MAFPDSLKQVKRRIFMEFLISQIIKTTKIIACIFSNMLFQKFNLKDFVGKKFNLKTFLTALLVGAYASECGCLIFLRGKPEKESNTFLCN